jgi:iron uptake system EfeUOB component EfeO/EfeM
VRRVVALAVVAAVVMAAAAAARAAASGASAERITFGVVTCAPGWRTPNPGRGRFAVVNQSGHRAAVYLYRADSGAIVAQLIGLPARASRTLTVRLRPGPYAWACDLDGFPRHTSDSRIVPVHPQIGGSGPAVVPVKAGQLVGPMLAYRRYVSGLTASLWTQVAALRAAIAAGDLAGAQAAWLPAHLTWLSIGQDDGAYGAFGDLGRQIDGTAAGLVRGVSDPGFTGFHKVEYDLWHRGDLGAAAADTARLAALVSRLTPARIAADLSLGAASVSAWTLRSHEVLEDALRDSLSGDDDYGSGTDLASVTADVAATREVLHLLAPLISPRAPYLVGTARGQLRTLDAAATATQVDGRWVAVSALPALARERINAAAGAALETLARVPDLLALGGT